QYALSLNFGSNPLPAVPLANTQALAGAVLASGGGLALTAERLSTADSDDLVPDPSFLAGLATAAPAFAAPAYDAAPALPAFRPVNGTPVADTALLAASFTLARSADGSSGVSVPVALLGRSGSAALDSALAGLATAPTGLARPSASESASWGASADAC